MRSKIRVLLADDHAILRSGLRLLIGAQPDMEVVGEAGDAHEAVRQARSLSPDVISLDLSMPGGSGLGTIERLRADAPGARIVVLTMHEDPAYVRAALAAGASGFLVKSAADTALISAIRAVARGRLFIDVENSEAVVRRYEFYRYDSDWGSANTFIDPETGLPTPYVDPENSEVVECVVDGCNDPTPDELGDFVGRQMAGFNIAPPACSNGQDDDGDGRVDYPDDAGCKDALSSNESPQCDDRDDNDGDGLVDLADPGCGGNASNDREKTAPAACGLLGIEPLAVLAALAVRRRRAAPRHEA